MKNKINFLNLDTKLYQKSIINSVKKVSLGKRIDTPLVIDLDPTTFCDLGCPECISHSVLQKGKFTDERLEKLAHEFAETGVKAVVLIGGGEPLLHNSVPSISKIMFEKGIKLGLVTNGTLITHRLDTLAKYMNWTRISVDASNQKTYDMFRPAKGNYSMFNKVLNGIENLTKVATGKVGFSFLILRRKSSTNFISNIKEISEAAKLAKNLGCDYFELKNSFDENHFLENFTPSEYDYIKEEIEKIKCIEEENFKIQINSGLQYCLSNKNNIKPQDKSYNTCLVSKLRTTITPNGCYVCAYHRGDSSKKYGDVYDQSFKKLWNSSKAIEKVQSVNPSLECKFHCARHKSNIAIENMKSIKDIDNFKINDYDFFI